MFHTDYKCVSPETALRSAVKDGDWVDFGFGAGFPELCDQALAGLTGGLHDVKVRGGLFYGNRIAVIEEDPDQESFTWYSWHLGAYERKMQKKGLVKFVPVILRSLPILYRRHIAADVACVPVSAPDADGWCSFGLAAYAWPAIIDSARTVIFEINENYPIIMGPDHSNAVHISKADYLIEGPHSPLPARVNKPPSAVESAIAKNVLAEIPDGACLTLGVGGVPFAVASAIADSDLRDLGCWTGTISDPFMQLARSGKLTNSRKEIDTGLSTWNLANGSAEFYEWLAEAADSFHPGDLEYVHSVHRMSQLSNLISINGGVAVDLMGQENGESAGTRQLSGIGGQLDFLESAFRSNGGRGFICLASTHKSKDGTITSNILPRIDGGAAVSAPRTMTQCIATEYGVAHLAGKSLADRAREMIKIAHPDFRADLGKRQVIRRIEYALTL